MLSPRASPRILLLALVALLIGVASAQHNHAHPYAPRKGAIAEHTRNGEHIEVTERHREPHVRVKRRNVTEMHEECRPDPRCKPCASFERTESYCLRTGFKQQVTCSVAGKVARILYEACESDSTMSALRFVGMCGVVFLGSALMVHLRKRCIIREHLEKLQAMSNV